MSNRLSSAQIRGARAMLDWSMVDLAERARVSVSTVKRAESTPSTAVSEEVCGLIQDAMEAEGIKFLPDDGEGHGMRLRRR